MEPGDRDYEGESSKMANSIFTSAMTLTKLGVPRIPQRYVLPPSDRPSCLLNLSDSTSSLLPTLDLSSLDHPSFRPHVVNQIRSACKEHGFFQVINHGIPLSVMKDALEAAMDFFNLPVEEKMVFMSDSVYEPVRYGTSLNHTTDKIHFWRDFIKHYSNPISNWIHLWPSNPPTYKEKMGKYATAVQGLEKKLIEAILESLGLRPDYLQEEVEEGSQVIAVNYYPACPEPELALGMPPHSDYGSLTVLLQSSPGLQLRNANNDWLSVPVIEGGLIVQLGDQMEVMSNGLYESIIHRVTVNAEDKRISIASLHSLALNKKIRPAPELLDGQNPASYNEFSFSDFLDFLSLNDITKGRYIDTLKKKP